MKNIIKALTKNITEDNFSEIDSILEEIHTWWKFSQEQVYWYYELLQEATLYRVEAGMYVDFKEMQSAITEGQFVAWYLEDDLIGSGVIS